MLCLFVSCAGSYEACGNTFPVTAVTHTVDPTVTANIPLWSLSYHVPHVSWRSEVNKTYTLIIWDAGALILHGVMFNIKASNLEDAQVCMAMQANSTMQGSL